MGKFEFDARAYRKASSHQKQWGKKILDDLPLEGNESVLDLGCGDGTLTKQLSEMVPNGRVLGIDSAAAMIEVARDLEADNLSFRRLDINDMAFENEFDLVFSNATIHYVKDHERLLTRCAAALTQNGIIRFGFAAKGNTGTLSGVIREVMNRSPYRDSFTSFEWPWYMPTADEYEVLVRRIGFNDAQIWSEDVERYFGSQEEMTRWIDQPVIIPFIRAIPEPLKQSFRNEVVDGMVLAAKQTDGRFRETMNRMNVFARK
jgi:trans-aconitate 2-methyltransferase